MLIAAGALYVVMGEAGDALMLLGALGMVMLITIVQARRADNALAALRDLASPRALVIRDGHEQRIAGSEVVRGDIVVLAEGDRVPADAILREASHLVVDESLLTGESVAVRKAASFELEKLEAPGGEALSSIYWGTLVTTGQGRAEIVATGGRTVLGSIGKNLKEIEPTPSSLETETAHMVRRLAMIGVAACLMVTVVFSLVRGGTLPRWREGALAGLAMAMALLPEEMPVIMTVFFALGARRLSRSQVLTRRTSAIESLGSASVLCVDKTCTLTQNVMILSQVVTGEGTVDLGRTDPPPAARVLLEVALLASKTSPFDAMERALLATALRHGVTPNVATAQLIREYALMPNLLAMSHAWQLDNQTVRVASKGAPEAIVGLCQLDAERRQAIEAEVTRLASQGFRVLGVAQGHLEPSKLPALQHDLQLDFIGLLAFVDPLRPAVPAAVAACYAAGVRVVMMTGDYPVTAQSIARQAGLRACDQVLTGAELARLTDAQLATVAASTDIFARVVPAQKLRLVEAFKANGDIVAMTGDGVNDAPALKAAHIGIAMGGRGTDVAREAAALVLLDDDFSSIVKAIALGRRIYDNTKKAMMFVLAVHVPIAGLSIIPVFFSDWPLLLLPVHVVFLELVIDPACSLLFEAEEGETDVMRHGPRSQTARVFSRETVAVALLQGLSLLVVCLAMFLYVRPGHSVNAARAATFVMLVVGLLMTILVNRSWTRHLFARRDATNPFLRWIVAGAAGLLAMTVWVPPVARRFYFAPLHVEDFWLSVFGGLTCVLWFEAWKWLRRRNPVQSVPV